MLLLFGYLAGAYSYSHQLWPLDSIISSHNATVAKKLSKNLDKWGAFSNLEGKKEIACPAQTASTAVILVLGQSNSANYAEKKYKTYFPTKVLNYYLGKCYSAESPLLGASGLEGEYLTMMADFLLKRGNARHIILVSEAIGGSKVSDWAKGGYLSQKLVSTLNGLLTRYEVTSVIWHQGESDYITKTSEENYRNSFLSIKKILDSYSVKAPIFMFVSTICGFDTRWDVLNPIAQAQRSLIDEKYIYLGVDTDAKLSADDRRAQSPSQEPNCHLNQQGQMKVANSMASRISLTK